MEISVFVADVLGSPYRNVVNNLNNFESMESFAARTTKQAGRKCVTGRRHIVYAMTRLTAAAAIVITATSARHGYATSLLEVSFLVLWFWILKKTASSRVIFFLCRDGSFVVMGTGVAFSHH